MAPYNFISSPPFEWLGLAYSANRTASRRSRLDDYQVYAANLSDCLVEVGLQDSYYLRAEDAVIEQKAADIR